MSALKPPPRVVVELHPDGTMAIEFYLNGARTRQPLYRGMEGVEIRQVLQRLARASAAEPTPADAAKKWVPSAYKRYGKPSEMLGKVPRAPQAASGPKAPSVRGKTKAKPAPYAIPFAAADDLL